MRLGLVGCGRLAESGYLPALAGLDDVVLAAVADPSAERRTRVAALAPGDPAQFDDAAQLAAAGIADAVVVATPAKSHVADATCLTEAGIAVLVEKPPAPDLVGAEGLSRLAPAPWIGFNRRFTHGARLLDSAPAEGPVDLDLELRYRRASWGAVAVGDPVILDLAPHLVDLALLLTDSPDAHVRAVRLGHERAEIELETARGSARIHCACDRAHRERVVVRVGGRSIASSAEGGAIGLFTSRLPGREHPLVASLRAQLAAFVQAARGGTGGLLATAEDGVRTMHVIDAAREAAASGRCM
jgi:predicted dehydrogenase